MAEETGVSVFTDIPESTSTRLNTDVQANSNFHGSGLPGLKRRGQGHGSRSWIKIDEHGDSKILELDKATVMRHCALPARDLRLLDPKFIYPSTILGREQAIVVNLEQIRCVITAEEVILMNSLDACVLQYESELCKRLQTNKDQPDGLPFEFRALELALELTCLSLDAQAKELELEVYPVLDELASSINTLNLERVRRLKGQLLALTQRVQKVCDEIEHLMDDDGDMAEMYLTEKKQRKEDFLSNDLYDQADIFGKIRGAPRSAPVSPVSSTTGVQKLQRAFSNLSSSKHGSVSASSNGQENIDQLEMLLEAYFVVIDSALNKLSSGNVQNQLIQFELLLTAATFVAAIFAMVTAVFGMNLKTTVFNDPDGFNWTLIITGLFCLIVYIAFLIYFKHKKLFPL
ncbi:magnesium transporter MRS2-5 isoform X2 [Lycium ferocissimum]|uniref:magnesium transporter MRS2-5 isoform X2 n=1 Tax=Lycium ferocissimum TaxID=112874 RepID=UPI0028163F66|nr:magnesium transporter MRS2-5 isoform X2 [Lycium ferocissimum]